ncbi:PAS domain-containing protein [Sneathiella chinensis]|uniref:PAS domain-containing protein n=1 Tax=Sneathiella chinensis TaxID=349750 RepID=A0ABQ5TZ27_9PROT|nr:PAS domain-containing protein [Sneathiella chinensis]GLQ04859.1 hypothetical protein GCM10007924_00800 [Sneathiella chinensis]
MTLDAEACYRAADGLLREVRDDRVQYLLSYYLEIHPGNRMPARSDFDPFRVPAALPEIVLVDVDPQPLRFRFRVVGSAVSDSMELDPTGRFLDEVYPGIEERYPHTDRVRVVETGLPVYRYGPASLPYRTDYHDLERLHLPLSKDGASVDMILSIMIHNPR